MQKGDSGGMHTLSCDAALPLPVPSSAANTTGSAEACRPLLDLRGVRGAAAAEDTPIVLAGDCPLLCCTDLTGGDAALWQGAAFPDRARLPQRRQGVWAAEAARVFVGMVAWGKCPGVNH